MVSAFPVKSGPFALLRAGFLAIQRIGFGGFFAMTNYAVTQSRGSPRGEILFSFTASPRFLA